MRATCALARALSKICGPRLLPRNQQHLHVSTVALSSRNKCGGCQPAAQRASGGGPLLHRRLTPTTHDEASARAPASDNRSFTRQVAGSWAAELLSLALGEREGGYFAESKKSNRLRSKKSIRLRSKNRFDSQANQKNRIDSDKKIIVIFRAMRLRQFLQVSLEDTCKCLWRTPASVLTGHPARFQIIR